MIKERQLSAALFVNENHAIVAWFKIGLADEEKILRLC